jgi:hypothetical protein
MEVEVWWNVQQNPAKTVRISFDDDIGGGRRVGRSCRRQEQKAQRVQNNLFLAIRVDTDERWREQQAFSHRALQMQKLDFRLAGESGVKLAKDAWQEG